MVPVKNYILHRQKTFTIEDTCEVDTLAASGNLPRLELFLAYPKYRYTTCSGAIRQGCAGSPISICTWGTWGLLRDAVTLSLQGVPPGVEPTDVRSYLAQLPGVAGVHDLHVWAMNTMALTCHLVMPGGVPGDALFTRLAHDLHDRFGIEHPTVQIEIGEPAHPCRLAPEHVV